MAQQRVGRVRRRSARLRIEVQHRIDDGAALRLRIGDDVLDAGGALLEEARDDGAPAKALSDSDQSCSMLLLSAVERDDAARDDIDADDDHQACENAARGLLPRRQRFAERDPGNAAEQCRRARKGRRAASRSGPRSHSSPPSPRRRRATATRDVPIGEGQRHAGREHEAGHDQKAAADPEEAREQADRRNRCRAAAATVPEPFRSIRRTSGSPAPSRLAASAPRRRSSRCRTGRGASRRRAPWRRPSRPTAPSTPAPANTAAQRHFTLPAPPVRDEIAERAHRDGEGACADRDVGRGDPDDIDEKWHREDRAAAADKAENKPDDRTGTRS